MAFVRVRDKSTRHEFSVEETAFDDSLHERVERQGVEASGTGGYPLPAKHKAPASAASPSSEKESR